MADLIPWLLAVAFVLNSIALIVAAGVQRTKGRERNAWKCLGGALLSIFTAVALNLSRTI